MRSPLLIAALAASAIATSLATADAAPRRHQAAPSQDYTQRFTNPFQPMDLFGGLSTSGDPHLAQIESQLNQAERTINADRRRGYITASQAQDAREQDRMIRNAAMDTISNNHGNIPDASYSALLGRVDALNQTIDMETSRS
jgi:hypothetical protein